VTSLPAACLRVVEALRLAGADCDVIATDHPARTAQEAARAVGTSPGQIVKSLVFQRGSAPLLVLASGANQVATERLGLRRVDADRVRDVTGYAIGGVPPLGHRTPLATLLDRDLLAYDVVWCAAGTPRHVFAIAPELLARITQATIAEVA
jgi:prolyl-tRNA editing enzyme YbaK/EbsC (Cys-tRNA(Pro) deacylase)